MNTPDSPAGAADEGGSPLRSYLAVGLAGLLLVGMALAVALWPDQTPPPPTLDDDIEDVEKALAAVNPGYVGIDACAACHAPRAAEFKTTRHFLACTTAAGVAAPGFAPGRGACATRFPGLRYEMTRSGDDFFATAIQDTPDGERRVSYKIGLVYGSANTRDEMYFAWEDGRLVRPPVAWLYPQARWGHDVDNQRVGDIHPSCLECHNTWIGHTQGPPVRYRRDDMLLGVTCERCHGPGRAHAEHHRKHPKGEARAILHPGTLSRERLTDICAQCHGNTRLAGGAFSYRPGQPLDTAYRTARAKFREDDTTTNQVQYLGESKCFQKSEMTCITCHDPHTPAPAHTGCLQCHKPASCKDRPSQPAAVRDDCVGCHMPQHVWMNSHFYTTSDDHYLPVAPRSEHRIGVYPWAKQAVELAWHRKQKDAASRAQAERLAALLTKYWLDEAGRRADAKRYKAGIGAFREALLVTPSPKTRERMQDLIKRQTELDDIFMRLEESDGRKPDEAIRLLKRALEIRPDDARAHAELGTIYSMTGRTADAIPHLQAVARCEPNDASGVTRLAWIAQGEGRPEEALGLCSQADMIAPGSPMTHHVRGLALSKLRRWPEAEAMFRKSLKNNPTDAEANKGLSVALRHQGDAAEAIRFARRALRWADPKDGEALAVLAEAFAAAGRPGEARRAFTHALPGAEANNPPLARAIRERLRELP